MKIQKALENRQNALDNIAKCIANAVNNDSGELNNYLGYVTSVMTKQNDAEYVLKIHGNLELEEMDDEFVDMAADRADFFQKQGSNEYSRDFDVEEMKLYNAQHYCKIVEVFSNK